MYLFLDRQKNCIWKMLWEGNEFGKKYSKGNLKARPSSSVGTATAYWLDGPGIESRWGETFHTSPDRPWGPLSLLYNGYRVFPGGKVRPGRDADPSPPSSAEV